MGLVNLLENRNERTKGFCIFRIDVFVRVAGAHKVSEIFLSFIIFLCKLWEYEFPFRSLQFMCKMDITPLLHGGSKD